MGGKLFKDRSTRISTDELYKIYDEVLNNFSEKYIKVELVEPLACKNDHGDIDVIVIPDLTYNGSMYAVRDNILEYNRNGNIHSILFHSEDTNKDVHVDFIHTNEDTFKTNLDYMRFGDFSGVIGVLSRRIHYQYGTHGLSKIYIDKRGQYHYIPLSNNLMYGLQILGYGDILPSYKQIKSLDDIVNFISYSELFDSEYYMLDNLMNNSDRKRLRTSRPSARYIREQLEKKNKKRTIEDNDYFLKILFPELHDIVVKKCNDIEEFVPYKSKYTGMWIMKNFNITPGPIIQDIKLHWSNIYGDNIDNLPEEELITVTNYFLSKRFEENIYK